MHKKSYILFYLLIGLTALLIMQLLYIQSTKSISKTQKEKKEQFIQIAGLPDLAIVTETTAIRHRSLADLFSIYRDDPDLREYFPSTFTYSHSHIINKESTIEP